MADPILGRAYPALLAPGLPVVVSYPEAKRHTAIVLDVPVAWPSGSSVRVYSYAQAWDAWVERLWVDYADPHTRDRVCRALEAHYGDGDQAMSVPHPTEVLPWSNYDHGMRAWMRLDYPEPKRLHALRAVADAVWGESAPEVSGG